MLAIRAWVTFIATLFICLTLLHLEMLGTNGGSHVLLKHATVHFTPDFKSPQQLQLAEPKC